MQPCAGCLGTAPSCPVDDADLAALARERGGVIDLTRPRALGLSEPAAYRLRHHELLSPVHPGVYVARSDVLDLPLREHAALRWLGPDAVLSGLSAAHAHGLLRSAPDLVWVTVPSGRVVRRALEHGVHVRRARVVEGSSWDDGRRVTPSARTIADLAAHVSDRDLAAHALTLLQRGSVTLGQLVRARDRTGVRPGRARLDRVLADLDPAVESVLGAELVSLLRAAGLPVEPGWTVPLLHGGAAVADAALPTCRIGFEADSAAFHSTPAQLEHDARRDRRLAAVGWTAPRFRTSEIRRQPRRVQREAVEVARAHGWPC